MINSELIAYFLALLVGISLGLIGSGGSILTVPILVYILKVEPFLATAYSLFIVGSTAMIGSIKNIISKVINYRITILFGLPSLLTVFFTRSFLLPLVPNTIEIGNLSVSKNLILMLLFAIVMLSSSIKMIKPSKAVNTNGESNAIRLILQGIFIGMVAGTVGAGGGFLIIPALILFANLPMKQAVATSLFIVAIQSLVGFLGDIQNPQIDWKMLFTFSAISIIGIFIGLYLTKFISDKHLKKGFGYFVLIMAFYILIKELFF